MPLLHEVIAVEKTIRTDVDRATTNEYHRLQRGDALTGISRTYRPVHEDDVVLPPENKLVQTRVADVLTRVRQHQTRLWDVTATRDYGNMDAVADVVLPDGTQLLGDVPVTYLLWLEKQLHDLVTVLRNVPVLDPAERWEYDPNADAYRSEATQTKSTRKTQEPVVLYHATDKHPAQVKVLDVDVVAGFWETTKFSGALPARVRDALVRRAEAVLEAVKQARARANTLTVEPIKIGATIFNYVLGDAQIMRETGE